MEYLSDPRLLEQALAKWDAPSCFASAGLQFQLAKYYKGELLAAPFKPMRQLLFLVRGKVSVYGLREDGSCFSVYPAGQSLLLGDVEFIRGEPLPFYTEALEDVLCVALAMEPHREILEGDARFLHFLLHSVADKFHLFFQMGAPAQPVEEKLIAFLRDIQPDHTLHGMSTGAMQLRCSRSQLQKVVRKLCCAGVLEKRKKGEYRLAQGRGG